MKAILWNINKRQHIGLLDTLLDQTSADVAIIPECPRTITLPSKFTRITTPYSSLAILSKSKGARILAEDPSRRFAAAMHDATGILIIGCHLPSKLHKSDSESDSLAAALRLREFIESAEVKAGHEQTLVLGDMNMDPYELGMVHCDGLHAVMSKSVAERVTRIVQRETRKFFYNPMWSQYGDGQKTTSATYFYASSASRAYFWHMFDQVLLRPSLISRLERLQIIETIGTLPLIGDDQRPLSSLSDHLPVSVQLRTTINKAP